MGSGFACMLITGSGICCPEATFSPNHQQPARVFLNLNLAKLALIHCTAGITYDQYITGCRHGNLSGPPGYKLFPCCTGETPPSHRQW